MGPFNRCDRENRFMYELYCRLVLKGMDFDSKAADNFYHLSFCKVLRMIGENIPMEEVLQLHKDIVIDNKGIK